MTKLKIYSGSCHCGAVRFRFKSEEIATGCRCNCSICVRKGAVMSSKYILPDEFEELRGKESLTLYQFGDKDVNHYFCKTCGVYPFHDSPIKSGYRVNLGCIDDLDVLALEISIVDGRSF